MAEMITLRRGLSAFQVQMISLGGIIGSCYFLGIGDSVRNLGPACVLALLLGGVIVWLVLNGIGELCVGLQCEGGFVAHARELVGRPWAAGVGWSYWFNWCAYVPSEMIAGGIIMHHLFPSVPVMSWAILFGMIVSAINLASVKSFGRVESVLAMIKLLAIVVFSAMALLIWLGFIGDNPRFIGLENLGGNPSLASLFPVGALVIAQRMVMILVNYQGSEIVALSAAETECPEENIPKAVRNVSYRIVAAYLIPVILVILIFPFKEAGVEESVFAVALERHGFAWADLFFMVVIASSALSCVNSGMYGATRSLYSLARERLAPGVFARLDDNGVPNRATIFTTLVCWAFVPLLMVFDGSVLFTWLLAVSGFTGAICWISISWCQIRFRKRLAAEGRSGKDLIFAMPGYPYLSFFAIYAQLACLAFVVFDANLRSCLYLGVPCLLIPMAVVYLMDRRRTNSRTFI